MRNLKMKQQKEEAEEVSEVSNFSVKRMMNSFFQIVNPTGFLKKSVILVFLLLFVNISRTLPESSLNSSFMQELTEEEVYVVTVKTKMRDRLINEVDRYIKRQAPTSKLTPEHVVDKCLEYEMDIIFVLSQGLLESHYVTKGVAARTNSVWNVGAFDNQKPRKWYKTADESLEPYLKLLRQDYLTNVVKKGKEVDTVYKEIHELVQDRSYINYAGKRFASARGYENAMRKLMVKIDMETSISFYQDILRMPNRQLLAYFKPTEIKINSDYYAFKDN